MKKYNDRDNTPLRFHNFLKNVSLPLGLVYYSIMIVYNLIVYGIESLATLQIIDYAFMVAAIVLIVIALRGLSKWKYSAWKCTVGLFAMILIYNITYLAILTILNLSGGDEVIDALRAIVIDPFVIVYYYKRKALFSEVKEKYINKAPITDNEKIDLAISKNETVEVVTPVVAKQEEKVCDLDEKKKEKKLKVRFCKFCGGQIDAQTKKCSGCGKQYFKGIKFNKFFTTVLMLSLVIITSIILNIVQFVEMNELNANIEYYKQKTDEKQTQISKLNKEIREKDDDLDFYHKYAVIVNDSSKKYHLHGCSDLGDSSFRIYNVSQAKNLGYSECSKCYNKTSILDSARKAALDELNKKYGVGQSVYVLNTS